MRSRPWIPPKNPIAGSLGSGLPKVSWYTGKNLSLALISQATRASRWPRPSSKIRSSSLNSGSVDMAMSSLYFRLLMRLVDHEDILSYVNCTPAKTVSVDQTPFPVHDDRLL